MLYPYGRYSARTDEPSGASHSNECESDRPRDAAPDDGRVDTRLSEDLRHLRDVAEHVRQVADRHRAAELGRTPLPVLEVADDRLAGDEELVHQHLPRPDCQPPFLDQPPDALRCLGRTSR